LANALAEDPDGFDAVDVLVPHHVYEPVAMEVLRAGKHLLVEKPLAPTIERCDRVLAAAAEAGVVFQVAENAQYRPEVTTVCALLAEGAIGEVITARASAFIPSLADFYGEDAWRFDPVVAGGGIAIDTCSHWIRPLRMWLGEVVDVVGVLGRPYPAMAAESLVRSLLLLTPASAPRSTCFSATRCSDRSRSFGLPARLAKSRTTPMVWFATSARVVGAGRRWAKLRATSKAMEAPSSTSLTRSSAAHHRRPPRPTPWGNFAPRWRCTGPPRRIAGSRCGEPPTVVGARAVARVRDGM